MSDDFDNSSIIIVSKEKRVSVRVGWLSCTNVGYLLMSVRNVKTANRGGRNKNNRTEPRA